MCRSRSDSGQKPRTTSHAVTSAVIASTTRDSAPRVQLTVTAKTLSPAVGVPALPDSGADITVAGADFLDAIGGHVNNLFDSEERPRAANGRLIHTLGMLPAKLQFGDVITQDRIHFLHGVTGLLLSWKVARAFCILPVDYPAQMPATSTEESADGDDTRRISTRSAAQATAAPPVQALDVPPDVIPETTSAMSRAVTRARRAAERSHPGSASTSTRPAASSTATRPTTAATASSPAATSAASISMANEARTAPATPAADDPASVAIFREFHDVLDGTIKIMPGEEFAIRLRSDATPFAISAPRRVPFALREPLLQELQKLEANDIITPVTEPTSWCAPIDVCEKKNGAGVRLCVDLSQLNDAVQREFYQPATPLECVTCIVSEETRYFTVFDALKGYHQCPLEPQRQPLTTFITPFGRYMYSRYVMYVPLPPRGATIGIRMRGTVHSG